MKVTALSRSIYSATCRHALTVALATVLAGTGMSAFAQADYTSSTLNDGGKILSIVREVVKPGKEGAAHEKTEMDFGHALTAAKSTDYYEGMTSMSGPGRALFISGYSSLADMEAKQKAYPASLLASLDKINEADGAMLSESTRTTYVRNDSLSTNVKAAPASARYMEITTVHVKPGREAEYERLGKIYVGDMMKAVPSAHWTCYSSYYGHTENTVYIFMTAFKSLAEADREMASQEDFVKAVGATELTQLNDGLTATAVSIETNLFSMSPKLSYPNPAMVAADPDFWKPKPVTKKTEAKPAQ